MKMQDITNNKKFWKTVRTYFSDKGYNQTKITIAKEDSIITDKKRIATLMQIKEAYSEILQEDNFSFKMVSMDEVKKIVLKLNSKNLPRMVPSLQVS